MRNIIFLVLIFCSLTSFAQRTWDDVAMEFARSLGKKVCPATYKNGTYRFTMSKPNSYRTKLDLETSWEGVVDVFWEPDQTFTIKGCLECDNDGTNCNFYETYRSENVTAAENSNGLLLTAAIVGGAAYALSSSSSSSESSSYNNSSSSSSGSSSNSSSSSSSSSDYAPQSMNGVEIISSSSYGSLAYEHAAVTLRNKNNYDVIVSIELKQNDEWESSILITDKSDMNGYNYSEDYNYLYTVKANSIRNVSLRGEGSGRPSSTRLSYVK
jgi:hypothetical protein